MLSTLLSGLFSATPSGSMPNVPYNYARIKNAQDRYNTVINNAGLQDMSSLQPLHTQELSDPDSRRH